MSWICPKCERELKHENAWHNCVKVSIDSLFAGKHDELMLVFDKLLAEVADWEDVLISTSKNCIVFVHRKTFLIIKPLKAALEVKFYSEKPLDFPFLFKAINHPGKSENFIRFTRTGQLGPVIFKLIRDSYTML